MTLRIRKKSSGASDAAASGSSGRSGRMTTGGLRPDLIAAGARRLAIIALVAASATAIFAVVDRVVSPLDPRSAVGVLWLFSALGSIGLSLSVAWIAYREMLSPEKLLDLGLLFEVVEALLLGVMYHSTGSLPGVMPRGWSAVAVWILAYPLIVPNTRRKMFVATLAAALMDPLALAVNVYFGAPRPTATAGLLMFLPTAVAASVAIIVSRIVFEMALAAGKGQEMGSYRLEELLGRGGMGEVWRASHRLLVRQAAVKLIRIDPGSDSRELLRRFEREARATAALRSPHTVDVYDYGTTEDGTFYYVMELLEGYDLETLIHRFGAIPPERAVFLLEQACHSLAEAHEGGLIHRDIKPANIYVCRYGIDWDFVKVLDFGLVKNPVADARGPVTVAGIIAGTPGYMSPEMGLGSPDVDWRSDIYALGCVAYWLVTGRRVFEEGSPMQVLMDHVQKAPTPPSRHVPGGLPAALDSVILSCLEKDPNNRPQSATELASHMRAISLGEQWTEDRARHWWLSNGLRGPGGAASAGSAGSSAALETPSDLAADAG